VVDFFTKPKLFRSSGARIPKGVLLCGPPGALTCCRTAGSACCAQWHYHLWHLHLCRDCDLDLSECFASVRTGCLPPALDAGTAMRITPHAKVCPRQARARRCWRARSPARRASRSCRSTRPSSWRCSSASGPPVSGRCSTRSAQDWMTRMSCCGQRLRGSDGLLVCRRPHAAEVTDDHRACTTADARWPDAGVVTSRLQLLYLSDQGFVT